MATFHDHRHNNTLEACAKTKEAGKRARRDPALSSIVSDNIILCEVA